MYLEKPSLIFFLILFISKDLIARSIAFESISLLPMCFFYQLWYSMLCILWDWCSDLIKLLQFIFIREGEVLVRGQYSYHIKYFHRKWHSNNFKAHFVVKERTAATERYVLIGVSCWVLEVVGLHTYCWNLKVNRTWKTWEPACHVMYLMQIYICHWINLLWNIFSLSLSCFHGILI